MKENKGRNQKKGIQQRTGHTKIYGNMYQDDKYSRLRVMKACQLAQKHYKGPNPFVLDIGCYTMEVCKYLRNYCHYIGIDEKIKHKDTINMDLNRDELDRRKIGARYADFDLIFAMEILEHLLHPDKILKACQVLLARRGILTISLPNENTLYHRIVMLLGLGCDAQAFKAYKHVHFPTIAQQRAFLKGHFTIIEEASYISTDMHKSRGEWIGKLAKKIPDQFWQWLADCWPGLFARGRIYVCKALK